MALAFRDTVRTLERALPPAHQERIYRWAGQTRRASGELAGTPRDVYDLGTLAGSQQPAIYAGPLEARIRWDAEHAAATYLGAVFRKRQYSLPSRNVPLRALGRLNLPEVFAGKLRARL